jgi:hypothetical protein
VHFDVVEVSGANQYTVMPAELVTTCWLPMVLTARAVPPAAEAGADADALPPAAAGVLPAAAELLLELAHADTVSARAASPATPHIFRISNSPLHSAKMISNRDHVRTSLSVQLVSGQLVSGGGSPS